MYCPSCGKTIQDDSKFCQYCGKNISGTAVASADEHSHPLQWEYKEIFIPNESFSQRFTLRLDRQNLPSASALINLWQSYKPQIPAHIKQDLDQGWEPDPNFMGETCLEYSVRNGKFSDQNTAEKATFFLGIIATFGIVILILPFILMTIHVVEPEGVRIRLRRLK